MDMRQERPELPQTLPHLTVWVWMLSCAVETVGFHMSQRMQHGDRLCEL